MKFQTHEDIDLLQQEMFLWCRDNFPEADAMQEFMGIVEEVGELAHAHLKHVEQIRGLQNAEDAYAKKVDAVGDILVYLFNYCSFEGISITAALELTWSKVAQRDWIANPDHADEPAHAES